MGKKKKLSKKKKSVAKKSAKKITKKSVKRSVKKSAKKAAKQISRRSSPSLFKKPAVNVRLIEAEINRLSDLLEIVKKKSVLVRRSLAYLEREQKNVLKQLKHARSFVLRLKNRGMQAFHNFPQNAEELYRQLKREFNRVSARWTA